MAKLFKSAEVNILVYILVILFGTGSWVAVNGLWVELPLLVQDLPEGWNLPSYLVIVVQIANIGPICYSIARKFCRTYVSEKLAVYVLVTIGAVACLLLAFVWKRTALVAGQEHSVALLTLAFFLATVDCTSSVLFVPFMSVLKPQYMTAFFIGEGMSGLVPSLVAIIQGVKGGGYHCVNETVNTTEGNKTILVPVNDPALFGLELFFGFLFAMMVVCGLAFAALNHLVVCRSEHVQRRIEAEDSSEGGENSIEGRRKEYTEVEQDEAVASTEPLRRMPTTIPKKVFLYLLLLTAWINAMGNGLLPSFQSYSAIPYGYTAYHFAVTLSMIANPATCFVVFMFPTKSKKLATVATLLATGFLAYISYLASTSPNPPLVDNTFGKICMVFVWIAIIAIISCVKVTLATIFRDVGENALFWFGATTQAGSAVGAIIAFVLVNSLNLFKSKPPCT